MTQLALNSFKTVTFEVTTSEESVYTSPVGYTSIVLYSHITNVGVTTSSFTISHYRGATQTEIIKNGTVPVSDAYIPLQGKMVLETGDIIKIQGTSYNSLKLILSILETANS